MAAALVVRSLRRNQNRRGLPCGERFTSAAIAIAAPGGRIEWVDFPLDRVGF